MRASFDASGLRRVQVALERKEGTVGAQAARVLRRTAHSIERDAKMLAPIGDDGVHDGLLRESIRSSFKGDGRFSSMSATIEATARYAGYVEHGTSDTAPQPYMRPAFDRNIEGFERAIGEIGGRIL